MSKGVKVQRCKKGKINFKFLVFNNLPKKIEMLFPHFVKSINYLTVTAQAFKLKLLKLFKNVVDHC
jgi:hypothetical protein